MGWSSPQLPAPRMTAVLTLSTRLTAATPSSRRKASLWQPSQESRSLLRLHTRAGLRLCDSTIKKPLSRSGPEPTSTRGNSAQSVWLWAPGGVSTRR